MDVQYIDVTTLCQYKYNRAPKGIRKIKTINMTKMWLEKYESPQKPGHIIPKLIILCMDMINAHNIETIIKMLQYEYDAKSVHMACNYAIKLHDMLGFCDVYDEVDISVSNILGRCDTLIKTADGYTIVEFKHTIDDVGYSQLFHYAALATLNNYDVKTLILCNTKLGKIVVYTVTDRFDDITADKYLHSSVNNVDI